MTLQINMATDALISVHVRKLIKLEIQRTRDKRDSFESNQSSLSFKVTRYTHNLPPFYRQHFSLSIKNYSADYTFQVYHCVQIPHD